MPINRKNFFILYLAERLRGSVYMKLKVVEWVDSEVKRGKGN